MSCLQMVSGMVLVTLIGVNLQQGSNAMHQPLTKPFQEQVLQQIIYNPMVINVTVKSHPCTRLVTLSTHPINTPCQQIIYNPMVIDITVKSHPCTRLVTVHCPSFATFSYHLVHPFHMIFPITELTLSSHSTSSHLHLFLPA